MTKADRDIIATLTSWPVYVPEWEEYAAVDDNGELHTAAMHHTCLVATQEANELIARHRAAQVAAGVNIVNAFADDVADAWASYAEAAEKARANVEAWLAEIEADKQ